MNIIHAFYDLGIIKFGDFTLKDGDKSLYYIDLRLLVSYPTLLSSISEKLIDVMYERKLMFDHLAGIPLAGIPIATAMSLSSASENKQK